MSCIVCKVYLLRSKVFHPLENGVGLGVKIQEYLLKENQHRIEDQERLEKVKYISATL